MSSFSISKGKQATKSINLLKVSQAKRRQLFIDKQKQSRHDQFIKQRQPQQQQQQDEPNSHDIDSDDVDNSMIEEQIPATSSIVSSITSSSIIPKSASLLYQACHPEWMLQVPALQSQYKQSHDVMTEEGNDAIAIDDDEDDEPESWLVKARPCGVPCLMDTYHNYHQSKTSSSNARSSNGSSIARIYSSNGILIFSCSSCIPKQCLLECIYDDQQKILYAMDLLVWKGQEIVNTTAEFRMYWLQTKIQESNESILATKSTKNEIPLLLVPWFECNFSGVMAAYAEFPLRYCRDGLVFYHKFGYYQQGVSPLVLRWADKHCSPFAGDQGDRIMLVSEQSSSECTAIRVRLSVSIPRRVEDAANTHMRFDMHESGVSDAKPIALDLITSDGALIATIPYSLAMTANQSFSLIPYGIQNDDVVTCELTCTFFSREHELGDIAGAQEESMIESDMPSLQIHNATVVKITPKGKSIKTADSWSKVEFLLRRKMDQTVTISDILSKCGV